MNKVIYQGSITLALFIILWKLLSGINWMQLLKIDSINQQTEEKIGDIIWDFIRKSEKTWEDTEAKQLIQNVLDQLCDANNIEKSQIKLHLIRKDEINAFALPDGHLVIYTGLIAHAEKPEEVAGVLAHELAHVQLNHVMKKLIKEVGLSILISISTGNDAGGMIKETARLLSSSAFDRSLEKEADLQALEYLMTADVNPEGLAEFLYAMAKKEPEMVKYFSWINTHPETEGRALYILEYLKDKKKTYSKVMPDESWELLKSSVKNI